MRGQKPEEKGLFQKHRWKESSLQAGDSWDGILFISEREKACLIKGTSLAPPPSLCA